MSLNVYKCIGKAKNGNACKSDSEINEFFRVTSFFLAIKNTYLESKNFSNPIK